VDKERSAEVKKGETAVPGGGTETGSTNIVVAVVIIVVVAIDVDAVIVRTNHPIAQALTDSPPFERLHGSHG
jgi:hypothetical protein